jgi:hypothetical protein
VSPAQSEAAAQTWSVSVAVHETWMFETHLATHDVASVPVVQCGKVSPASIPSSLSVPQQSGVEPWQSEGPVHPIESPVGQVSTHSDIFVARLAQQTCEPGHGVAGQPVTAPLLPPSDVPPLELPLEPPLEPPLDPPLDPPLELPPDELLVEAS